MQNTNNNYKKYAHKLPMPATIAREDTLESVTKEPFVTFPRYLTEHLRNHLITYRELELYFWMRMHANMLGIASVNIRAILDDLPHFQSTDYISKLLRSLRNKKYIYYYDRKGYRGSFDVHFGDWLIKGHKTKQLDRFFNNTLVRGGDSIISEAVANNTPTLTTYSPRLHRQEAAENTSDNLCVDTSTVRGTNKDKEIEKEKNTNELSNLEKADEKHCKVLTRDFVPKNDNERRCKHIAMEIQDANINFTLSILRNENEGGIEVLEEAFAEFKKMRQYYIQIDKPLRKPAAFFNECVKNAKENKKYNPKSTKYSHLS